MKVKRLRESIRPRERMMQDDRLPIVSWKPCCNRIADILDLIERIDILPRAIGEYALIAEVDRPTLFVNS